MKSVKRLSLLTMAVCMFACSKDEEAEKNMAPEISDQAFTAQENLDAGSQIGTLKATDADEDNLSFTLTTNSDALFALTADGKLSLASGKTLDYETKTSHSLEVQVSDGEETANATVTVTVADVDENTAPTAAAQAFTVAEDIAEDAEIGTVVATDAEGDALTYSIKTDADDLFEITDDGKLSLQDGKALDYETKTSHEVVVTVTDGSLSADATITITVTDVVENTAPTAAEQDFTVAEDVADNAEIGAVMATDAEGDALTFSIKTDADALFEITADGKLSLQDGKNLDYETKTSHTIAVTVTDGSLSTDVSITINVTDVDEGAVTVPNSRPFIMTMDLKFLPGEAQGLVYFRVLDKTQYDVVIDWGDGTLERNAFVDSTNPNSTESFLPHTYANRQEYTIKIYGKFPHMRTDAQLITAIEQWGDIEWENMDDMFNSAVHLTSITATDAPNLSKATSMERMFRNCTEFNANLNNWDVSNITSMERMFERASKFNGNISNWDVSKVTNFSRMFQVATAFNQDLSNWDVEEATNMFAMFEVASSFNQNISSWDVSKVQNVTTMFAGATAFSQDLSGWDTASVTACSNFGNNSGLTAAQLPTLGCFAQN